MSKIQPIFAERAYEVAKRPEISRLNIPDLSDYELLDDAHLLALVETLRPIIYAHTSVIINQAIPQLPKFLPDYREGELDSILGFKNDLSRTASGVVFDVCSSSELDELLDVTDDMLCVLRYARIRQIYDPILPDAMTPDTKELVARGASTGIRLSIATIDYIYRMIRTNKLDINPYDLQNSEQARAVLNSISNSIARRVGLQDLGPIMRVMQGADNPFERLEGFAFKYLPTDFAPPFHTKLKSLIDEVRLKRSQINSIDGYDPYLLDKLMCPAVVGIGDVNPINDLVEWVVRMADSQRAYDFRELD